MSKALQRTHGGPQADELAALGVRPEELIDFSANTNGYGPPAELTAALAEANVTRYPDTQCREARAALADWQGVDRAEVALGNGAAELLWTLARVLLKPGDTALLVEPTFCEFRLACQSLGVEVAEWRATAGEAFQIDLPAAVAAARRAGARAVYLCTPNTPTGAATRAQAVAAAARSAPELHWVVDQSFLSLSVDHADRAVAMPNNVVRVRSLTKDLGIPGVRVGYALGPGAYLQAVEAQRPAWTVSAAAQAAAALAPALDAFVAESRERLLAETQTLAEALRSLGLKPFASACPFLLVPLAGAAALRVRLLSRHRLLVRDCASFGLPDHLRLAARGAPAQAQLVAALREELAA